MCLQSPHFRFTTILIHFDQMFIPCKSDGLCFPSITYNVSAVRFVRTSCSVIVQPPVSLNRAGSCFNLTETALILPHVVRMCFYLFIIISIFILCSLFILSLENYNFFIYPLLYFELFLTLFTFFSFLFPVFIAFFTTGHNSPTMILSSLCF